MGLDVQRVQLSCKPCHPQVSNPQVGSMRTHKCHHKLCLRKPYRSGCSFLLRKVCWERTFLLSPQSHFIIFFFTFILDINLLFQELNAKHLPTEVPVWRFIKLTSSIEVIFILGNPLSKKFTCVFKHILRIIRKI